jgi:hypothetical protein
VGGVCVAGWEVFVLFDGNESEGLQDRLGAVGYFVGEVEKREFALGIEAKSPEQSEDL